jgi:hypothetical protein
MEAQGNRMADEAAKEATLQSEAPIFHLTTVIPPPPSITPVLSSRGKMISELGASKTPERK